MMMRSILARIYQLKKDQRVLSEKAVANAPQLSVALDTLEWVLVTEGEIGQGFYYLLEASVRENNSMTRYH